MSLTRADFLKGAAATLAVGLAGPRAAGALQNPACAIIPAWMGCLPKPDPTCGTPAGLIGITETADQGVAEMTLLLTWKLSQAPVAAGLFALAPGDPFAAARAQAMTVTANWPVPSDFWSQLATAMICAAVAQITDRGLNAIADGAKSQAAVQSLVASAAGAQEALGVYNHRFMNTRKDGCGQPVYSYFPGQAQPTVAVAVSDAYLAALDLKAVNDPAGARLEASLLLFKLGLAYEWSLVPDYRPQVISVWSRRDHASPAYLAATTAWPQINYLSTAFSGDNVLLAACRALLGVIRQQLDQQMRGACMFTIRTLWYGEALAAFVNDQGAAAGLATGAAWNKFDMNAMPMGGPGPFC